MSGNFINKFYRRRHVSRHCSSASRGFTLLETVIAMALLSLVLAGSYALLVGSYATLRRTQEKLYVNRLLETSIEMTRNLSFEDIAGDADGDPVGYANLGKPIEFQTESSLLLGKNNQVLYSKGTPDTGDPNAEMPLQDGKGQIQFEKINNDLYRVTATVTWVPFRLAASSKSVTTYIARKGINRR